jgi:hypothetical protein
MFVLSAFTGAALLAQESASLTGEKILAPFKRDLQQALTNGLAQGPEAAIAVCKLKAPEITNTLSNNGILVGRTSKQLRNPANTAPAWVAPILALYESDPAERKPKAVPLANNRSGYAEPIIVQPMCVACHGSSLTPQINDLLSTHYPDDQAIGYMAGDLRGVFWAEFPN